MKPNREILEQQLEEHAEKLRGFKSYIKELKDMTAKHGTEKEHFNEDLMEAEHNVTYYEADMARIKHEIGKLPEGEPTQTGGGTILPQTAKQGIGAFILTSIGFVAGVILGTRLNSRRSSED